MSQSPPARSPVIPVAINFLSRIPNLRSITLREYAVLSPNNHALPALAETWARILTTPRTRAPPLSSRSCPA